jgi:hypothetical protein
MSDPANPLIAKLEAIAGRIDPSVGAIAILIAGDVEIELGISETGDSRFDARRLATALEQAVRMGSVKPCELDAAAIIAGQPTGPVGDDAQLPYLSQLLRRGAS